MLKSEQKVIVDTTFLLPALGIEVEEEAMHIIPYLRLFKVCYLEVCILEAMWKILRVVPESKLDRVREGLRAIRESYTLIQSPPKAYIEAYRIYHKGHKDFIDTLLYYTAKELNIPLLIVDKPFIKFLKRQGYNIKIILTPKKHTV